MAQQADFTSTSAALRQRALAEQETLLLRQIEAIKQDLDYRRSSTESVLRAEIQQRVITPSILPTRCISATGAAERCADSGADC